MVSFQIVLHFGLLGYVNWFCDRDFWQKLIIVLSHINRLILSISKLDTSIFQIAHYFWLSFIQSILLDQVADAIFICRLLGIHVLSIRQLEICLSHSFFLHLEILSAINNIILCNFMFAHGVGLWNICCFIVSEMKCGRPGFCLSRSVKFSLVFINCRYVATTLGGNRLHCFSLKR